MIDCIIVGAGPGGIVCTKEMLEKGITNTVCLEQSSSLGGVFTGSYDNLYLTSSGAFSMFSDFWIGDGNAHSFWTKSEVLDYWTRYAAHFCVLKHIRFDATVAKVERLADENWRVTLASDEVLDCKNLVLATGNNDVASFPAWRDQATSIPTMHSKDYRNAKGLENKRVLIVGGGESASDIALEISKVAEQCWVSLRNGTGWIVPRMRGKNAADASTHRGFWNLPRKYGAAVSVALLSNDRALANDDPEMAALVSLNERIPSIKGIWGTYGTKTMALPKAIAHYGCHVVPEITGVQDGGKTLHLKDGLTLDSVDTIIFSTGFKNKVPFMPKELQECDPRSLYKHMFHPDIGPSLVWLGWARPAFGSQFPIMEMQSRYCAQIQANSLTLPDDHQMKIDIERDRAIYLEQFEHTGTRVRSLVDYFKYMGDLAKILGCTPPLIRSFFMRPRLWLHLVFGPMQASQFRLRGDGKKAVLAREIIMKLPVSPFNTVVKIGLKGRIGVVLGKFRPAKQPRNRD
ncbi:MAG: NAD(P)-binding domain-containing protein [Rhodobacteraceae bacterium]|nr:NAD(P)-binding domain-containing protein [Paracoccaceae bacterium]